MSTQMESCVGKTHKEITKIFLAKHGAMADAIKIGAKWRKIGAEA